VTLLVQQGKEMIGDGRKIEPGLFGAVGIAHQIGRAMLLRHRLVAELEHAASRILPGRRTPFRRGAWHRSSTRVSR
jgi:hypothetical protein